MKSLAQTLWRQPRHNPSPALLLAGAALLSGCDQTTICTIGRVPTSRMAVYAADTQLCYRITIYRDEGEFLAEVVRPPASPALEGEPRCAAPYEGEVLTRLEGSYPAETVEARTLPWEDLVEQTCSYTARRRRLPYLQRRPCQGDRFIVVPMSYWQRGLNESVPVLVFDRDSDLSASPVLTALRSALTDAFKRGQPSDPSSDPPLGSAALPYPPSE